MSQGVGSAPVSHPMCACWMQQCLFSQLEISTHSRIAIRMYQKSQIDINGKIRYLHRDAAAELTSIWRGGRTNLEWFFEIAHIQFSSLIRSRRLPATIQLIVPVIIMSASDSQDCECSKFTESTINFSGDRHWLFPKRTAEAGPMTRQMARALEATR